MCLVLLSEEVWVNRDTFLAASCQGGSFVVGYLGSQRTGVFDVKLPSWPACAWGKWGASCLGTSLGRFGETFVEGRSRQGGRGSEQTVQTGVETSWRGATMCGL